MNPLSKLSDMLQVMGDKAKAEIAAFNAENSPIVEWSEEGCVCGMFILDGHVFYGTRYKNGYHPTKLSMIPDAVTAFLSREVSS